MGHEFTSFFAKHSITMKLKPVNTKAFTVERHNEIVRQGMHRLYDLCVQHCVAVPLRHRLVEVLFFKNSLLQYGGFSPYNSVIGQQPAMLPDIEGTNLELADDQREGTQLGTNRGAVRLRELGPCSKLVHTLGHCEQQRLGQSRLDSSRNSMLVILWTIGGNSPTRKRVAGLARPLSTTRRRFEKMV